LYTDIFGLVKFYKLG